MHSCRRSLTLRFGSNQLIRIRHHATAARLHVRTNPNQISSQLGLRSQLPPDSSGYQSSPIEPDSNGKQKQKQLPESDEVSDAEWELRTGRAIYTLQQTLPDFFNIGLVSSLEEDHIHRATLSESILDRDGVHHNGEVGIYSPKIRLSYTPPVALPAPLPQTLHIEGLPLYTASSVFIRHTLNALYTDLRVTLSRLSATPTHSSSNEKQPEPALLPPAESTRKAKMKREKSFAISFSVIGRSRVTGTKGQWDVTSTYTFSPISGLILSHVVNEIDPAPHRAAYEALRAGIGMRWVTPTVDDGRLAAGHSTAAATTQPQ